MSERSRGACKDCGGAFYLPSRGHEADLARGLSSPERCPKCRESNRRKINSIGQAYWEPRLETDDAKRAWGKFGLGRLSREREPITVERYEGIPTDLPLRLGRNEPTPTASPEDVQIASKFVKIAPVAERLVENLLDPRGARVSILVGPTGTGKSTWVPYRLLRSPLGEAGKILVTQPRTITLQQDGESEDPTTTPGFIAARLMKVPSPYVGAGQEIGFQFRGVYDQKDNYTRLLFVTDGTLIKWIESGQIAEYHVLMVDEAHEQNRNMELILALLRARMPLWPHLRLVIASATIDVDRFRSFFAGRHSAPVFVAAPEDARGLATATPKPIHDRFLRGSASPSDDFYTVDGSLSSLERLKPKERASNLADAVAALVVRIVSDAKFTRLGLPQGDILIFVPRIRDVQATLEAVNARRSDLNVLACHAQMEEWERQALRASEHRAEVACKAGKATTPQRVIVATNYAETSVTMMNLRYVIDSGLLVEREWDTQTCSYAFEVKWHSQDGCKQRKGRVGRVIEGEVFRLYSMEEHERNMREHTAPEITRVPLDSFLLSAKAAGIEDLESFEWLGKTDQDANDQELKRALRALSQKGAVDRVGDCTSRGVELAGYQVASLDHALCMSESDAFACTLEMSTFLAFVGCRERLFVGGSLGSLGYLRWRRGCLDDLELYLRVFHQWSRVRSDAGNDAACRRWCEAQGLRPDALSERRSACEDLTKALSPRTHDNITERELDLARLHRVRFVIARCIPEWIYVRNEAKDLVPLHPDRCPNSGPVVIDRDSACSGNQSIPAALVSLGRTRVSDTVFAQHVVALTPKWLASLDATPVSAALMLRDILLEEAELAQNAGRQVKSMPPSLAFRSVSIGDRLRLRVARRDAASRTVLCTCDPGAPILVVAEEWTKRYEPGDEFTADVASVPPAGSDPPAILVSQDKIVRELVARTHPTNARLHRVLSSNDGVECELSDFGLFGYLHFENVGFQERASVADSRVGTALSVCVTGGTPPGSLQLASAAVVQGRATAISPGSRYESAIVELCTRAQDGVISGLRVEIVPGVTGYLRRDNVGFAERDRILGTPVGGTTSVVVTGGSTNNWQLVTSAVAEGRATTLSKGQVFNGVVCELRSTDGTPSGLRLEIVPGRVAFLPLRALGRLAKFRWAATTIGSPLGVRVSVVRSVGDYILELPATTFRQGETASGVVVALTNNQWGVAGVEIELEPCLVSAWLHFTQAPRGFLDKLQLWSRVTVRLDHWEPPDGPRRRGQWKVSVP